MTCADAESLRLASLQTLEATGYVCHPYMNITNGIHSRGSKLQSNRPLTQETQSFLQIPMSDRGRSYSRSRSPPPRRGRSRDRSYSRRSNSRSYSRSRSYTRSYTRSPTPPITRKIIVEKLTKNVTEAHIREIFGTYGKIESIHMPLNRRFNINRGLCYIEYDSATDADKAIANMHEGQLDGNVLIVSPVLPKRSASYSRSPSPRRRRGSYGRDTSRRRRSYSRSRSRSRSRSPRRR